MDAAATPARVRLSHARADPAHAAGYALLGEVPLAGGRAGRLAHSLRLGPDRRVQRYLRLEFSGHLLPEAQSGACLFRVEAAGVKLRHELAAMLQMALELSALGDAELQPAANGSWLCIVPPCALPDLMMPGVAAHIIHTQIVARCAECLCARCRRAQGRPAGGNRLVV